MRANMPAMAHDLFSEIEAFVRETGMSRHRFGIKAVSNGRLYDRLESGGRVWPEQEARIRAFMRQHRAKTQPERGAA